MEAKLKNPDYPLDVIQQGDCLRYFECIPDESVDLVFVDPPYNIGFDYGEGEYQDNLKPDDYNAWTLDWIRQAHRVLCPFGSFWMLSGDDWAAELKINARTQGFHLRSWIVWYYTFGVNSVKKFSRSHAHLLYFTKHKTRFTFNASQIRVPSSRVLVYNDRRANPDGRLPDDTWILRPQEVEEGFPAEGDTWHVPRVCGSFKQRQPGAANQLPEQLLGRVIRTCTSEGDVVLDPMAGTGTTLAVAKKLNRRYLGFEISKHFTDMATRRLADVRPGDALDGPIPQGG